MSRMVSPLKGQAAVAAAKAVQVQAQQAAPRKGKKARRRSERAAMRAEAQARLDRHAKAAEAQARSEQWQRNKEIAVTMQAATRSLMSGVPCGRDREETDPAVSRMARQQP